MTEPLLANKYYHIFNRGNNSDSVFKSYDDYSYFIHLYSIYAHPFFETFSWCLMKNHYHFCVRVKNENEFERFDKRNRWKIEPVIKWQMYSINEIPLEKQIIPKPHRMLGFMFDAYSKYYNKKYDRTGVVFERGFEKKLIEKEDYLMELITYIHNNPVKHQISKDAGLYQWSSYNEILNNSSAFCNSEKIIQMFDSKENFVFIHQSKHADE
ncbi:MAG: hypothetical protein A2W93_04625 [Bacteroidetes bacterium GWF2_43_63]|nr:MAG: hypothetical protein A2W94_12615 [Bacteroidetes bacterium GWE2_42_42]OFY56045.1 MAG: hypothetical protein A2W93_04625 [Bacteroidetes bacterium GWF2_43_63]HBG70709.1 hypothetical protein [Bacteroidales bacterium]HCB62463.1 hypothetical protein [Bacteroidales bacterium]HCY21918.1 hypothetical protein [Bacteroidales bacterium]